MMTKSSVTSISLHDFDQNKVHLSIPNLSIDEFERPPSNMIILSSKDVRQDELRSILIQSMFFGSIDCRQVNIDFIGCSSVSGVTLIIDDAEFVEFDPFIFRFIFWSNKVERRPNNSIKLFSFFDDEFLVNSSFSLILNYRRFDRSSLFHLLECSSLERIDLFSLFEVCRRIWSTTVLSICRSLVDN